MSKAIEAATQYEWGACPECGAPMDFLMHSYEEGEGEWRHWACCERDRCRWHIGTNLFSGPEVIAAENPAYVTEAREQVDGYREVTADPIPAWALALIVWQPPPSASIEEGEA